MKKNKFKYIITEFHEFKFPKIIKRDLVLPNTNKITTVIGNRRVGKTFYFYQLITELLNSKINKNQILYINFDDDRLYPLKLSDLDDLLESYYELFPENKNKMKYFFFDEIQNIKNWELFIRRINDKEKIKLFLTGSSSKLLSHEIATTLRGRTLSFNLYTLNFKEFLEFKNITFKKEDIYSSKRYTLQKLFLEYLNNGSFPEVVLEKETKKEILNNYYEMFIYKDLVERYSIRNIDLLKQLSKYLLTNVSNLFSVSSYYKLINSENSISKETIYEYLSYLKEINLIFTVPIYSYSLKQQQVNPSKIYTIDNGLRNAVSFKFSEDEGRLAENLVFIELKRRLKEIYYWRGKGEIDFVVKNKDGSVDLINVCYSGEIPQREVDSITEFIEKYPRKKISKCLILTKDIEKTEKNIEYLPIWKWLLK
ncbi:MAG TPA: ATP-binding protein [Candidatus Diapherotrites archaeon]|nr:ATP-binding protein [Candidatus Diapherotrites archaeon]